MVTPSGIPQVKKGGWWVGKWQCLSHPKSILCPRGQRGKIKDIQQIPSNFIQITTSRTPALPHSNVLQHNNVLPGKHGKTKEVSQSAICS